MNHKTLTVVTDAWWPQVNGVVNTLMQTRAALTELGYQVTMLTPQDHTTLPCPGYPEIRLALRSSAKLHARLDELRPDHIHIATEGPLGLAARAFCRRRGLAFSSSYHTQFPEYIRKRLPVPFAVSYAFMRRFHNAAARTMVATAGQEAVLKHWRFRNIVRWTRGVDTALFSPGERAQLDVARPVFTFTGRVAVEKNLEAFLSLDLPGTKCVIGDGPALRDLRKRYPKTLFPGYKFGKDLVRHLAAADVFVFPSRTDTFGLVMLEAMACGVPVAAFRSPDRWTSSPGALPASWTRICARRRSRTLPRGGAETHLNGIEPAVQRQPGTGRLTTGTAAAGVQPPSIS